MPRACQCAWCGVERQAGVQRSRCFVRRLLGRLLLQLPRQRCLPALPLLEPHNLRLLHVPGRTVVC
jgi:hypothetical protein